MKSEARNQKYDLEERTLLFAKNIRKLANATKKTIAGFEDCRQLIRSAGSVGANYCEANQSISKKDFILRIKICRKEARESRYWLELLDIRDDKVLEQRDKLIQEANELTMIFSAIMRKSIKK